MTIAYLSTSELLLYGGIIVMAAAVMFSVVCIAIFKSTGKKIRGLMEREYGKPKE